jgi:transposase
MWSISKVVSYHFNRKVKHASQWILRHDNAPAHSSLLVWDFLTKTDTTIIPKPPYSPGLAPADFFLFLKLKSILKGRSFATIEEIKENSLRDLKVIPKQVFQDFFQNWKKLWGRCISSGAGVR